MVKKTLCLIAVALALASCASTGDINKPFGYTKSPCACGKLSFPNHAEG